MGKKKKTKNWIYSNLFWLLIVLGILIIYLSSLDFLNEYFQGILEKAGLAILSSGVFASVLKSIQFTGIFKEEIEKIVLGTKFIENRNDLPKLWKKISRGVYNKKFPKISSELEDIVLNTYFPTNHKFYYEDFRYTLNIKELTSENVIKFSQTYQFRVVLAEGESEAKMEGVFTIEKKPELEGKELINKRVYYKIDDEDMLDKLVEIPSENEFEKRIDFHLIVPDKKSFLLEAKEEREYCINEDNYKLIRVNAITKEMDISINYPENMIVSFFNIGLVNKFERKHVEHKRTISRVHKRGLILPHQGFGITFGIK